MIFDDHSQLFWSRPVIDVGDSQSCPVCGDPYIGGPGCRAGTCAAEPEDGFIRCSICGTTVSGDDLVEGTDGGVAHALCLLPKDCDDEL